MPDSFEDIALVAAEFDLGRLQLIERVKQGNSPAYQVQSDHGSFFIKSKMQRSTEWVELYRVVEKVLNNRGIRQASMLLSTSGVPISTQGYSVFEWLEGDAITAINDPQFQAHVEHLALYNRALADVPVAALTAKNLRRPDDIWRKAASLDYMLDYFRLDPASLGISRDVTAITGQALNLLRQHRVAIESLHCQLIHSDIGPGNIIFKGDQVISIIDFTPGYEPHLYALCISLFWHCVFDQPDMLAQSRISTAARIYRDHHEVTPEEGNCFFALMVRAAAYRLFMRLNARAEAGIDREAAPFSPGSTERMAGCVKRVIGWELFIKECF